MRVQKLRRHQSENGVTEKLKPLIALRIAAVTFGCVGAVRQRGLEKLPIFELVANFFFKVIQFYYVFGFLYS